MFRLKMSLSQAKVSAGTITGAASA